MIRRLVSRRLRELRIDGTDGVENSIEIAVVEQGDTIDALERETGCPIADNPFDETRFPEPDFVPACEVIEEHATCYEMVFILNDDGSGVLIFVPKQPDIDQDLLSLCRTYAVKPLKRHRY